MLTMIAARPPLSHQGFDQTFGCDLPTLVPAYTLIFAQSRGFVRHSIGCKAMVATLLILQPVRPHSTATSMRLRMPSTLVAKSRMDREPIDGIRKILTQLAMWARALMPRTSVLRAAISNHASASGNLHQTLKI
jgi:hypothetical protein